MKKYLRYEVIKMEKIKKFIPTLLFLVFFLFNTSHSVYATEDTQDDLKQSATPSEAVKDESLIQSTSTNFIVAFDPNDGITTYENFYKVDVSNGGLIPSRPSLPKRDGYIFIGWYGFLDDQDEPFFWSFNSDTVSDNITLWAYWEKACLVAFDPDDGITEYKDFYKAVFPSGSLISSIPDDPKRDGYIFSGWYGYLDENDKPVFWNFDNDTVLHNITLWAAWEINTEPGNTDGNDENGNGNSNKFPQKGNGGSSSNNKGEPAPVNTPVNEEEIPVLEDLISVIREETPAPAENMTTNNKLDSVPKTGNRDILRYGFNLSLSLILLPVLLYRKKER